MQLESDHELSRVKGLSCNHYIKLRLHNWGRWARRDGLHHLGYGKSNIAQIMSSGGVFIDNSQRSESQLSYPEEEEMDKWITELGSFRPLEALALCDFYIAGGGKQAIAKKRKIGVRALEYRLKYAHVWLEGRIFDKTLDSAAQKQYKS